MTRIRAVLLDVDGTLVDSNDAHARAWVEAFAAEQLEIDFDAVRRCIGMGGDKLMPTVSGIEESSALGQRISTWRRQIFKAEYLPRLEAFPGAGDLVAALKHWGFQLAAASSAKQDELGPLLEIAHARTLLDAATSSDDADESKPDPDIIEAALQKVKVSAADAVLIGDTPYDVEAATRAGVAMIAFRCGGWRDADLAGAIAIYDGPSDLLRQLDTSPLGVRGGTS